MKKGKILGYFIVVAVAAVGVLVSDSSQAENAAVKEGVMNFDQPDEGMDIGETEMQEACLLETLSDSEFQAMIQDKKVQTYGAETTVEPDAYEPNDSWEHPFQYSETTKLTGTPFTEGYVSSNCHETGNEDWFEIGLNSRYTYDVVLKNLYRQDRHIYIWGKPYGYWEKWGAPNPQTGRPEKYKFKPATTYRYYIQIVGGEPEIASFFFAAEREGTINTALWPSELE